MDKRLINDDYLEDEEKSQKRTKQSWQQNNKIILWRVCSSWEYEITAKTNRVLGGIKIAQTKQLGEINDISDATPSTNWVWIEILYGKNESEKMRMFGLKDKNDYFNDSEVVLKNMVKVANNNLLAKNSSSFTVKNVEEINLSDSLKRLEGVVIKCVVDKKNLRTDELENMQNLQQTQNYKFTEQEVILDKGTELDSVKYDAIRMNEDSDIIKIDMTKKDWPKIKKQLIADSINEIRGAEKKKITESRVNDGDNDDDDTSCRCTLI